MIKGLSSLQTVLGVSGSTNNWKVDPKRALVLLYPNLLGWNFLIAWQAPGNSLFSRACNILAPTFLLTMRQAFAKPWLLIKN